MNIIGSLFAQNSPDKIVESLKVENTYIPVPLPMETATQFNAFSGVLWIFIIVVCAVLIRALWRCPEWISQHTLIKNWGGPYTVQNKMLRALGFVVFVVGLMTGRFMEGVIAATLLLIGTNVRPQGYGE